MNREDVKRQVLQKVRFPEGRHGDADKIVEAWLNNYPFKFVFGPSEVQAACRLVRREMRLP